MSREQLRILYLGTVQGVGFRYTVKRLVAEGERAELQAFQQAVRDSGLGGLIRQEDETWSATTDGLRGFEIVR